MKKSRRWISQMQSLQIRHEGKLFWPPMWSHIYKATTVLETKDQYSYYNWSFGTPRMITDQEVYQTAKRFHDDVVGGAVVVGAPPETHAQEQEATDDPGEAAIL